MDYGMRVLHAGKDFFKLKNPIWVGRVELQKIRIHNLRSILSQTAGDKDNPDGRK